jgi:predicted choloylglycine hydrolase
MHRFFKFIVGIVLCLVVVVSGLLFYVHTVAKIEIPEISNTQILSAQKVERDSLFTIGDNWFRKSETGLYEVYVEGDAFERGVVLGKLTEELVKKQEIVFNKQIEQLVPSAFYRKFLTYFVGWFNRDLDKHVPEEFKLEILGVSQSASHEYDHIAPSYQRILNYHGAHDIGHALQNMSLVGCTSFGTWNSASSDSSLTIGRNFDFFVGEEFAQDKIVAFYKPSSGFNFMMITWGGMTGVLSGMNDQGLTVTLNAAKSEIPTGAATPVSLVAREILQYASTIDEALAIAEKRKTFVAESFLIGSAKYNQAAIIEKSPE